MLIPFNESTNKTGIIQECERKLFSSDYGRISGNATLLAEFTNRINQALDDIAIKMFQVDNTWSFDDSEHSDFPEATTDLVASQSDYALASTHMIIDRVEVKDTAGNWRKITPLAEQSLNIPVSDFMDEPADPIYYTLKSNSIILYPAPNYAQDDSLKVFFQRPMEYFASSDTTKTAGFPSLFQKLIPLYASYYYATDNLLESSVLIENQIAKKEKDLKLFMRGRQKDMPKKVVPHYKSSK
jgi:hypothetical protein